MRQAKMVSTSLSSDIQKVLPLWAEVTQSLTFFLNFERFAADDDAVKNIKGFALQVVFKNEAIKSLDLGTLAKFFDGRRQSV